MIALKVQDTELTKYLKEYYVSEITGRVMLVFDEDISLEDSFYEDDEMSSFAYIYTADDEAGEYSDGLYVINRIADRYYPDLLIRSELPEKGTMDGCVEELFIRLSSVLPPDKIHMLEVRGELAGSVKTGVTAFVDKLIENEKVNDELGKTHKLRDEKINHFTEELAAWIHASESMRRQIGDLIRYTLITDIPLDSIIEDMRREGMLPVSDKKEGKKVLGELQRRIDGSAV